MRFSIAKDKITAYFDDPNRENPIRMDLSALCALSRDEVRTLLECTSKFVSSKKVSTQVGTVRCSAAKYGYFIQERGSTELPNEFTDWQVHILDWFAWFLAYNHESLALGRRVQDWDTIAIPWLKSLADEGVVPDGITLPRAKHGSETGRRVDRVRPALLGEASPKPTQRPVNRTIAGPIFWRDDIAYLDEVEASLILRNQKIREVADDYWLRAVKDYRSGRSLMRRISDDEFSHRESSGDWLTQSHSKTKNQKTLVSSPRAHDGASWALRIMHCLLSQCSDQFVFAQKNLMRHPGLLRQFLQQPRCTPIAEMIDKAALREDQLALLDTRQLVARFLGVLSALDAAVAMVILIQEHPQFTPHALSTAEIVGQSGKSRIVEIGEENCLLFSVDKPRARSRKHAILSRRAERIVRHLLRTTQGVREALRRIGYPHWRRLFLGFSSGPSNRIGILHISANVLSSDKRTSLIKFYPELSAVGLKAGVFDFTKLRTTQGAIRWFECGSVHAASKLLGNSYRVALDHYVPEPLVRLWNERAIRRFQNTLIVLAASEEEYYLDVVDITTFDDLQAFVVQILDENPPGSSPIGNELHRRLRHSPELVSTPSQDSSLLSVRMGRGALALLYAYKEKALTKVHPSKLDRIDPGTRVSPRHLIQLAALFQYATERSDVSLVMQETLDLASLRELDASARQILPRILRNLRDLRVSAVWDAD